MLVINETSVFYLDGKYLVNMDDGFLQIDSIKHKFYEQNIKIEAYDSQKRYIKNTSLIDYKEEVTLYVISEYFGSKKATLFYTINNEQLKDLGKGYIGLE